MDPKSILVVGDAMLDVSIQGTVSRIAPEAPVPVVLSQSKTFALGGAANVAANVSRLGVVVDFVFDPDSHRCKPPFYSLENQALLAQGKNIMPFTTLLSDAAINVRGPTGCQPLTTKYRIFSGTYLVARYDEEQTLSESESASILCSASRLIQNAPNRYGIIILSDYDKGVFFSRSELRSLLDLAKSHEIPVFVDTKSRDIDKYHGVSLMTPNAAELSLLTGCSADENKSIQRLGEMALTVSVRTGATILTTIGADGVLMTDPVSHETAHYPAVSPKYLCDTTGAGDTLIAALAVACLEGRSLSQALNFAQQAASIAVSKPGTYAVRREEVEKSFTPLRTNRPEILTVPALQARLNLGDSGVIGMTTGCFDLLHTGHLSSIREASEKCDYLIVALNTDESVRRLKGKSRPIVSWNDRAAAVQQLQFSGCIVPLDSDDPSDLLRMVRPKLFFKGEEYFTNRKILCSAVLKEIGAVTVFLPMVGSTKTSSLIDAVLEKSVV